MAEPIILKVDNVEYNSVADFLRRNNFNAHTFSKAMKLFVNEPEHKYVKAAHYLLNKRMIEPEKEIILVWGYKFNSLKEMSNYFNVSLNSLYKRMCDLHLNAEEAIGLLLEQSKEEWEAGQKVKKLQSDLLSKGFCSMPKNVSM